jgi:hypothetical protein
VTAGHQKIRDGAAVTIINGAKGPTEGAATDKPGTNGGKGA